MAERVLVTGGTGFIGQHLVRALRERGAEVRLLVRPRRSPQDESVKKLQAAGVELVWGDLVDRAALARALEGASLLFHLAGRLHEAGVPDQEYEQLHVEGTRRLLMCAVESDTLRAVLHCSTTGVLGATGRQPATEEWPPRPGNIYERTKAEGEQVALGIARDHGLPVRVVRPSLVYGPGDLHLLGWFRAIARGYYFLIGPGDNLFHPIFVEDVVEGMLRCVERSTAPGRVYDLVGERPVTFRELSEAIAASLGRRLPRWYLPVPLARQLATLMEHLPGLPATRAPLTRSRISFMTESRAYCGKRARDELGFQARVDLQAGLARTVAWYRSEGLL